MKHGVNGTESKIRFQWGWGTMEKCYFEAKFCLRGVRFSFSPDWASLRETRLMLRGGYIKSRGCMQLPASHRATAFPWPERVRSAGPYKWNMIPQPDFCFLGMSGH